MNTTRQKAPLVAIAESSLPDGIRQTISSEPIIPTIAAENDWGLCITLFDKKFLTYEAGLLV
jgi:hypothetical protein